MRVPFSSTLRHDVVGVSLRNFKSKTPSGIEKCRFTAGAKAFMQFDYDHIRLADPVVSGLKNFSLRALNVELEEIDFLETAFAYDRREGKAL